GTIVSSANTLNCVNGSTLLNMTNSATVDVEIDGITSTGCSYGADNQSNTHKLTLANSKISVKATMSGYQGETDFEHDNITVSEELAEVGGAQPVTVVYDHNDIACVGADASHMCDFGGSTFNGGGTWNMTLTNNNITCNDASFCRGG